MNISSSECDVYNFTTKILNRTKRHDDFLMPLNLTDCRIDHVEFHDRCAYLDQVDHESCFEKIESIDYTTFLFCFGTKSMTHYVFVFAIILIFCLYLFLILGITADQFFCPALTVIANTLRMSESLAGVTVLAFGNGAPDLFMALSDPHGDTELMYNELMGGGAFLISIIGGTIIIIRSFRIDGFKIARDCLFFVLAINYIAYAIHDKKFTFQETAIIISVYCAFIAVVLIEVFLEKSGEVIKIDRYQPSELDSAPVSMIQQLVNSINPFYGEDAPSSKCEFVFLLFQAPIIIVLKILIPVVDYTVEREGWSKLLNMIHCLILPQLFLLVTEMHLIHIWNFPLAAIVFLVTIPFFVIIGCGTSKEKVPKWHILFSILSFIGASCVIYKVANEIMAILNVIGQATGLSHSILGITILSWGNSVGDLVSNIVLAKKGYAKFGFSGCFGGAMFNCLTGIGVTFILKLTAAQNRVAFGREGAMGPNCTIYLFLILMLILLAFILTNFWARRIIGVYMITVYVIFILFCCLNEAEIIHPFGTDHSDQLKIQFGSLVLENES